jgi:hypothetical protein
MRTALKSAFDKLRQMQTENGGFAWFKGGPENRYITQYIISGIGKLLKLKAIPTELQVAFHKVIVDGIVFLDKQIKSDYEMQMRGPAQPLNPIQIQYLSRALFRNNCSRQCLDALNHFRNCR